jgi:hypothetical protein
LCSRLRQDIKQRENVVSKEQKKQAQLDKVVVKQSANRNKLVIQSAFIKQTQTQLELVAATQELNHVTGSVLDGVQKFENQKRSDLKASLGEFLYCEILYHSK